MLEDELFLGRDCGTISGEDQEDPSIFEAQVFLASSTVVLSCYCPTGRSTVRWRDGK